MIRKSKTSITSNKSITGFSLIEILVVVAIFAVLGVLSTRSIFLTVRSSKKSDSLVRVRESVNYSLAILERQIRNAQSVDCAGSSSTNLVYTALEGEATFFSCAGTYIASGSARLTSTDVTITNCSFTCNQTDSNTPPSVKLVISAEDAISTSVEKGQVSVQTEIVARNY